jgi:RNA polymerase sigma-70 factor (ECF subfamily)
VAAIRAALDLKAKRGGEPMPTADVGETLGADDDAEVKLLRARYLGDFQAALDEALGRLTPKDRTLLRHHIVDAMNVDQLAAIHSVHRVTMWRWLSAARARVLDEVRRILGQRLHLPADELTSLMRGLRSQLRVSVARALGPK